MTRSRYSRFQPGLVALEARCLMAHNALEMMRPTVAAPHVAAEIGTSRLAAPKTIHAEAAPAGPTVYKTEVITHLNQFQDSLGAMRIGGNYSVRITVGRGTVKKVGDTFQQTFPAVGGDTWMVVVKTPLKPGDTAGQLKFSRVVAWYNNTPSIKGLNYEVSVTMNLTLFNKVKLGDLIRWVPSANPSQPNYFKLDANLTETEKLLVSEVTDLPNLRTGSITNIGPSSDQFNCYAYAADSTNPTSIGWVAGNQGAPSDATKVVPINNMGDLLDVYKREGWTVVSRGPTEPPVPKSGLVAIYLDSSGSATHAALVTPGGVFAKMGRLGTFKFDSLGQMAGGVFGNPGIWLERTH
jgi:hypothetical protein